METLRTPDERFHDLPGYPFEPHYTEVPDGDGGALRIHHVDEGPRDGKVVLCMHGQPTWSYLYRHMIPMLTGEGLRVLAPDLVGYGRSDKPAALEDYSYQRQVDWLTSWLLENDVRGATLVGQDWGGLIGLRMVADNPERFDRVVAANTGLPCPVKVLDETVRAVKDFRNSAPTPTMQEMQQQLMNRNLGNRELTFAYWQKWTWETEDFPVGTMLSGSVHGRSLSADEAAAYDAPFPDASYKMAARAMPSQVPTLPDDPSLPAQIAAWQVFSKWTKPFLCAFTDNDPVTRGGDKPFLDRVPGTKGQPHVTIEGGGHFLQEGRGEQLAQIVTDFVTSANSASSS